MKKFKVLICLFVFCLCFLGIDSVKADIDYCSPDDKYETASSCTFHSPASAVSPDVNINLYFGKTLNGKYCAEVKSINLEAWWDVMKWSVEKRRQVIAFDLTNETMSDVLNNGTCPKLKFVDQYELLTGKRVKMTVSDEKLEGIFGFIGDDASCFVSGLPLFNIAGRCWAIQGEDWKEISSGEMEETVKESEEFRDDEYNQKQIDKIKEQARKDKTDNVNPQYGVSESQQVSCSDLLGDFAPILKNLFFVICVIGIVILIFTMSGDFVKAITSGDSDALPVAFKNSTKRIAATIILLLLPIVLNFVIDIVNNNIVVVSTDEGVKGYRIGNLYDCKFTLNKDGQIVKKNK